MKISVALTLAASLLLTGCDKKSEDGNQPVENKNSLRFTIKEPQEHLGHSSDIIEGHYIHPVWIDGCRGRLVDSNEDFIIWWSNEDELRGLPLKFQAEKTYEIRFSGELETGIMGYKGKCIQAKRIEELVEADGTD